MEIRGSSSGTRKSVIGQRGQIEMCHEMSAGFGRDFHRAEKKGALELHAFFPTVSAEWRDFRWRAIKKAFDLRAALHLSRARTAQSPRFTIAS